MKRDNVNIVFLTEAREAYMAPVVEMVEVRVEKGFELSGSPGEGSGQEEGKGYTW